MLEIQDAARVITESIDPQARVIFGAIKDEKLKKNEIKVTVIATGFPEEHGSHNAAISRRAPMAQPEHIEEERVVPESRGRIFNSLGGPRRTEMEEPTVASTPKVDMMEPKPELPRRDPKPVDVIDEEEDDWGAVPAFLRRSKLK